MRIWGEFLAISPLGDSARVAGNVNASEIFGRGISQGVSLSYYPHTDRTAGKLAAKFGYAVMRDALTNAFREFWPDIATHVLHRHP